MSNQSIPLLSPKQMADADRLTIEAGTAGIVLMRRAGRAVAEAALAHAAEVPLTRPRILILCGPGNNGGDGFVAARDLRSGGCEVEVVLESDPAALSGDAAIAFAEMANEPTPAADVDYDKYDMIIDALFGAGLSRAVDSQTADMIKNANGCMAYRIAIDLPTGINGATGQALGQVFAADQTVTFFLAKPGHYLQPGRTFAGQLTVADIGINKSCLKTIQPDTTLCSLDAEDEAALPCHAKLAHKYDRGHALVVGGRSPTLGACRLTAGAALRGGAGLVTLAAPANTFDIQASALTDVMVKPFNDSPDLLSVIEHEPRFRALAAGPGLGVSDDSSRMIQSMIALKRAMVLDADALTSVAPWPQSIANTVFAPLILTPHEGEFKRLFPHIDLLHGRLQAARQAARESKACIILKGPDTVIAAPDGRAAISYDAPSWLSVAGTGDVLTGLVLSGLVQGLDGYDASKRAVCLHNRAAKQLGVGMIASDLLGEIPGALAAAIVPD